MTDEPTAKCLLPLLEQLFEEKGYPVAAFENLANPEEWELSIYVDSESSAQTLGMVHALSAEFAANLSFNSEEIPDIDWVSMTQSQLHPVRTGRIIVHGSHDREVPAPNDIAICLDAGMAFGTGHHGTTAGCLLALDKLSKKRSFRQVLDLGTGSGVLAIAAAKLHRAKITAADNDPVAIEIARRNTRMNDMANRIDCVVSDGFHNRRIAEGTSYDLVMANILAGPLKKMARDIAKNTAPGGYVILSGLLPHQKSAIATNYRIQNLVMNNWFVLDNWLTLILRKPVRQDQATASRPFAGS